jgi:glycosyltransferase involved in cell wall biosynthesis
LNISDCRVAIVCDWLDKYAGSERVLEQIIALFPQAVLFSSVDFVPLTERHFLQQKSVATTWLQRLPFARKHFRKYLPLMPLAMRSLDLRNYDLILSSSHAIAKNVITHANQCHICYCHTPMRYAWDMREQYLKDYHLENAPKRWLANWILNGLQRWDKARSAGVLQFIANSENVARRIGRAYGRPATVIFPPVEVTPPNNLAADRGDYYITVSRLVPYKRVDVLVAAFAGLSTRLLVIGQGESLPQLQAMATANVEFLGFVEVEKMQSLVANAKAFVYAADEDFGISPVEAQALGTPVIAFGQGGNLETVSAAPDAPTGLFFQVQTASSVVEAIDKFAQLQTTALAIKAEDCQRHAATFSAEIFRKQYFSFVQTTWAQFDARYAAPTAVHA